MSEKYLRPIPSKASRLDWRYAIADLAVGAFSLAAARPEFVKTDLLFILLAVFTVPVSAAIEKWRDLGLPDMDLVSCFQEAVTLGTKPPNLKGDIACSVAGNIISLFWFAQNVQKECSRSQFEADTPSDLPTIVDRFMTEMSRIDLEQQSQE